MLTPREKSPLPENVPRGGSNPRRCGQRAQGLPAELFRPHTVSASDGNLICNFRLSVAARATEAVGCSTNVSATRGGDAWCNGLHVCIPSLPPVLLCGFESSLGLESSGCSMWHFLKLVARGFLRVLRFPPLLHRLNGSANKIKLK